MNRSGSYTYTFSNYLLLISLAGYVSCMVISYSLWLPVNNVLPQIAIMPFLGDLPVYVDVSVSISLFVLLLSGIILNKKNRVLLYFILTFSILAILFDHNRVQPWVYYFWFLILLVSTRMRDRQLAVLVRYMFAGVYIWSALQKLNYTFFNETFLWINDPVWSLLDHQPGSEQSLIAAFAVIVEFFAGAGLLMRKTRRLSIVTLIFMHLYILAVLGPLGRNVNSVIWPWNLAFIAILILLFTTEQRKSQYRSLVYLPAFWKTLVILLFGMLPALSLFGWWPQYFSSALYSGNKAKSVFYLSDEMTQRLSENSRSGMNVNDNSISLNTWSLRELGVPPYPSLHVQERMFYRLCASAGEESPLLVFEGYSRPDIMDGERSKKTLFCEDLTDTSTGD